MQFAAGIDFKEVVFDHRHGVERLQWEPAPPETSATTCGARLEMPIGRQVVRAQIHAFHAVSVGVPRLLASLQPDQKPPRLQGRNGADKEKPRRGPP
jgi:hypothetical protein